MYLFCFFSLAHGGPERYTSVQVGTNWNSDCPQPKVGLEKKEPSPRGEEKLTIADRAWSLLADHDTQCIFSRAMSGVSTNTPTE